MNFLNIHKYHIFSIFIILGISFLGYFYLVKPEIEYRQKIDTKITEEVLKTKQHNIIPLGLDLVGGSQLVYDADVSELDPLEIDGSMTALKTVLERRLNPFGTTEVSIAVEKPSIFAGVDANKLRRVVIEIPGVTDPLEARKKIGKIPTLEFRIQKSPTEFEEALLTGRYLKTAKLAFDQTTSEPIVSLEFTEKGGKVFEQLTTENIGEVMAIFLDGKIISAPVIRTAIYGRHAIIEGQFTIEEAKELANNLKFGALPVPITLASYNTISASLGQDVLSLGVKAALMGLATVFIFLIFFYRVAGLVAALALISYVVLTLSIFKLLGFVFTAAGIAGFIISIGMAVDANILIFERTKEELKHKKIKDAITAGWKRAWLSIRDGNLSSIMTAVILFYTATSLVQGFAVTFGFGVIVSMFSAIVITRIFLYAIVSENNSTKNKKFLFGYLKK